MASASSPQDYNALGTAGISAWPGNVARVQHMVTTTQIDDMIRNTYSSGRLRVERLSNQPLPLESCFFNFAIARQFQNSDASGKGSVAKPSPGLSLVARLGIEPSPSSDQTSLSTLFQSRTQRDGTHSPPNHVLIWGQVGMGKTTLCKKIVHEFHQNGLWKDLYDRVIWFSLGKLNGTRARNVVELLQKEFHLTEFGEQALQVLQQLVDDSRTLFVLDGLDEVSFVPKRNSMEKSVLHELLSRSHVIITSRPYNTCGLGCRLPDFELELLGVDPLQVEKYLQQAVEDPNLPDTSIGGIRSFPKQHPLAECLARIPVQLDAIHCTWKTESFLHDRFTMTALYLVISRSLWKRSALQFGAANDGSLITRQQLDHWPRECFEQFIETEALSIQELAFRGLCEQIIEFSVKDAEVSKILRSMPNDKLMHIPFLRLSNTRVAVEDWTFHLIHPTYQEFLAAQYFVRRWVIGATISEWQQTANGTLSNQEIGTVTPQEFVQKRRYVDHYSIFWRFVVGLLQDECNQEHLHQFLDLLDSGPIDRVGFAHQQLVTHCLGELHSDDSTVGVRVQQLENHHVQWLLDQPKLGGNPWEKSPAYYFIAETQFSSSALARLLSKKDIEAEVLEALCRRSSIPSNALGVVLRTLDESASKTVRGLIWQLVEKHWSKSARLAESAVKPLIILLCESEDSFRPATVSIPAQQDIPHDTSFQTSCRQLHSPDTTNGIGSDFACGERCHISSIRVKIMEDLLQDTSESIRSMAAYFLAWQASLPDKATRTLIELLHNQDVSPRFGALSPADQSAALPNRAAEALITLSHDPDETVRNTAVSAPDGEHIVVDTMSRTTAELIDDPVALLQSEIVSAIDGQLTHAGMLIESMIEFLSDPEDSTRLDALTFFEQEVILPDIVIEALLRLMDDPNEDVSLKVEAILERQLEYLDLIDLSGGSGQDAVRREVCESF